MDETTLQVYSLLFIMATVLLVYTARFLEGRRQSRRPQRPIAAFERLPAWTGKAIETNRPLHLAFGSAAIGEDSTAVALAQAEFFHHIINDANLGDVSPILSSSAPATIPLSQATLRRAWAGDDYLSHARWYPAGKRSLAYAAAISADMPADQPAAHIMAGSFGPELALLLDSAHRRDQGSLAVSDQLTGQAIAYAMADEVLLGEELFAAASYLAPDGPTAIDAVLLDVWRSLLLLALPALLLLSFSEQLPWLSWALVAVVLAIVIIIGVIAYRRR